MTTRRSYQDACAAAHGLDLVGERWALLVVRELLLGPKRFTDLRAGLPGISANVLTQRLGELEEAAVVRRRKLPPPASAWIYELTEWGLELEPVILALGKWAVRSPAKGPAPHFSIDAFVLSMRAMFIPAAARGVRLRLELRFGEDRFAAAVDDGVFHVVRGAAERPEGVVSSEPMAMAGLLYGKQDLEAFLSSGAGRLEGDRTALERFQMLFARPVPVATP